MFILDREGTDEDDEEEDVSQWEDVVTGLIAAGLFESDPLEWYDHLVVWNIKHKTPTTVQLYMAQ